MTKRNAFTVRNPYSKPCVLDAREAPIYDVFVADGWLWLIAPHYAGKALIGIKARFGGDEVLGEWIGDDYWYTCQIRFAIPERLRKAESFCVTLRAWKSVEWSVDVSLAERRPTGFLAIQTLARYDWPYIAEWLEWHRLLGVDHFFVYNHGEPRLTAAIGGRDWVTEIPWSGGYHVYPPEWEPWWPADSHYYTQGPATTHCLRKYGPGFDWMMMIDCDEFLHPDDPTNFLGYVRSARVYDDNDKGGSSSASAIRVRGRWYGGVGVSHHPPPSLIRNYVYREEGFSASTKMIVRPEQVRCFQVHECKLFGGETWMCPAGKLHYHHYSAASEHKRRRGRDALGFADMVQDDGLARMRDELANRNKP